MADEDRKPTDPKAEERKRRPGGVLLHEDREGGRTMLTLPDKVPPWVWAMAVLAGAGTSGGIGSVLGASQAEEDLARLQEQVARLEEKNDHLDEKLDELKLAIVRAHPQLVP